MNLTDALTAIAAQLGLDAAQLIAYAAEDTVGGFSFDETTRQWGTGSIWEVEGQILYALTRALRPERVAEFGTNEGCSATHFLSALIVNGAGTLYSVDPWEGAGQRVPEHLRLYWYPEHWTGIEWLDMQQDASFDILFEDMVHGVVATRDWWLVAQRKIKPGGVIISHDAAHHLVGDDVRRGIEQSGVQATVYAIDPSDCGLAVWQAPGAVALGWVEGELSLPEHSVMTTAFTPEDALKAFPDADIIVDFETPDVEGGPVWDDVVGLDAEVHAPAEIEELPEPKPAPKKRGRKPKAAK